MRKLMLGVCLLCGTLLFGCNNQKETSFIPIESVPTATIEHEVVEEPTKDYLVTKHLLAMFKISFESEAPNGKVEYYMYDKGEKQSDGGEWEQVTVFCEISEDGIRELSKQPNNQQAMDSLEYLTKEYYNMLRNGLDNKTSDVKLYVQLYNGKYNGTYDQYTIYGDSGVYVNYINNTTEFDVIK